MKEVQCPSQSGIICDSDRWRKIPCQSLSSGPYGLMTSLLKTVCPVLALLAFWGGGVAWHRQLFRYRLQLATPTLRERSLSSLGPFLFCSPLFSSGSTSSTITSTTTPWVLAPTGPDVVLFSFTSLAA